MTFWRCSDVTFASLVRWKLCDYPRPVLVIEVTLRDIDKTLQWRHNERLKSPTSAVFAQLLVQAQIKENVKALRHWPLCGEFIGDRRIPRTKASNMEIVSIWWRHHECATKLFCISPVWNVCVYSSDDACGISSNLAKAQVKKHLMIYFFYNYMSDTYTHVLGRTEMLANFFVSGMSLVRMTHKNSQKQCHCYNTYSWQTVTWISSILIFRGMMWSYPFDFTGNDHMPTT